MTSPPRRPADEELVPEDDAVIGTAFRRSMIVIGVVACLLAPLPFLLKEEEVTEEVKEKDLASILDRKEASETLPTLPFTDVTVAAGIKFVHENGARGEKLLPETMGAGAAFFDHDGDGDQDLLLQNGRPWPGDSEDAPASDPSSAGPTLYENDGDGGFRDVTVAAGLDVSIYGTGVAAADLDDDGLPELYLTALGENRLLRNVGGRYEDITAEAGVAGAADAWSTSAAYFDLENDGDLDLFVCNYVTWSRAIDAELAYSLNGTDRAYGPPTNYAGAFCVLYRNDGDLRFTDVSEEAGIRVTNPVTGVPAAKALGVVAGDLDRDGRCDLVVANDTVANFLFVNRGDGTFENRADIAGVAYDADGRATGAMGIDVAAFRGDDALGIAIGNFSNEMTSLFVSQKDALFFSDDAIGEGVGAPSRLSLTFGLFFFDADLDGREDLLAANGHLEETIQEVQPSQRYRQPAQLFWNRGPTARSCFAPLPAESLGDLPLPIAGRGATYADIDGDGDLDVLLTQSGGRPLLLRNDQSTGHHWSRLKLIGPPGNRDALGARVIATIGGRIVRRDVRATRSYQCQVELPITIGLGASTKVDAVKVVWPDGTEQPVEDVAIDGTTAVRHGG